MSIAPNIKSDARQFIAERAFQTLYWSEVAREAAAYARAFAGAPKDLLLPNEGAAR